MHLRGDPCGLVCVLLIYVCIAYADYVICVWMVTPIFGASIWGALNLVIFNTLLFMTLLAHARTMVTDPGMVPINKTRVRGAARPRLVSSSEDDESSSDRDLMMLRSRNGAAEDWTMCTRCESFRPPRAHHCRVCRRCVRKMDHHCPWVNNCVGEFNQKYFLQFLFYVGISSFYALLCVILSWMYDDPFASTGLKGPFGQNAHHAKVLHSIFVSMECVMFGMFVLAVSCDQLSAIFTEETAVEAVQRRSRQGFKKARRRSRLSLLREVCGPGPISTWFCPCTSKTSERDVVSYPRDVSHFDV